MVLCFITRLLWQPNTRFGCGCPHDLKYFSCTTCCHHCNSFIFNKMATSGLEHKLNTFLLLCDLSSLALSYDFWTESSLLYHRAMRESSYAVTDEQNIPLYLSTAAHEELPINIFFSMSLTLKNLEKNQHSPGTGHRHYFSLLIPILAE